MKIDKMGSTEMKRSSYYVLFMGAKESKGLRGIGYIEPVLQYFISQEHRMQALKVTLQVSTKGLRIIPSALPILQTLSNKITNGLGSSSRGSKEDIIEKHFIPHSAITCVFQSPSPNDDIVSCILMIYNPDTNCPVHVHSYRCDSSETATILKAQLEALVNREENQKKFRELESRLKSKGLLFTIGRRDTGTPEFDCRTSDSSDNSDRGFSSGSGTSQLTSSDHRVASLYDSLAAELRAKLNLRKRNTPLLLPPRDYDTMSRQHGNLSGIETRRCLNPAVVGPSKGSAIQQRSRRSYASREQESCGRSSGIGSAEDNGSPIHDQVLDSHALQSSSDDEDWTGTQVIATERSQFLVRPILPTSTLQLVGTTKMTSGTSIARASSPPPPPLPKRPELRQRSPEVMIPAPPPPGLNLAKEKFEGVRQKWENRDHQYVKQKSHDSLDEGYRSREAVEADYRRQLSRESLLRSLSRSKAGSRDSLDRWVENGVRTRGMWRQVEYEPQSRGSGIPDCCNGQGIINCHSYSEELSPSPNGVGKTSNFSIDRTQPLSHSYGRNTIEMGAKQLKLDTTISQNHYPSNTTNTTTTATRIGIETKKIGGSNRDKSYRELGDQERFPGLDRETARTLHASNVNLSQQHIYSEPSFNESQRSANNNNSPANSKFKRFSFTFWK